ASGGESREGTDSMDRRECLRSLSIGAAGAAGMAAEGAEPKVSLGIGASLGGKRPFPADNPWNEDISAKPVDPHSDALIQSIGAFKGLHPDFGRAARNGTIGIPYVVVAGGQPPGPGRIEYARRRHPRPSPSPPQPP